MVLPAIKKYLNIQTSSSPLVVFRISFGLLIFFSIIRFWSKGWIDFLYIEPTYHFSYQFFEWIKPIGLFTYLIFFTCLLSALCVTLGYKYRISTSILFLTYTYIELMDKTTYLNHYYLISLLAFMLIFLPGDSKLSVGSHKKSRFENVPKWTIDSLRLLLFIVYFYAGLAKINSDWLLEAQPLKIWLMSKYELPFFGDNLLQKKWVHYFMSWGGMLYDLSIPFLLLIKRTRIFAFIMVIIFHVMTKILFPAIGMFPYIMIISCLIFFDSTFHEKIIEFISKRIKFFKKGILVSKKEDFNNSVSFNKISFSVICIFLIIQLILPIRYKFYPGELFWNERGYRFSWRVMLVEKKGFTTFKVIDKENDKVFYVDNEAYLTEFQEKQMSFQPDFIYEFANYLGDSYSSKGFREVEIHVDSFVTLNGRRSERLIKPNTNVYKVERSTFYKKYIIPYKYEIKKI
jgi:hypothetical protein